MFAQQIWNNFDFAKTAASWVAILDKLRVQPGMKISEFFFGPQQVSMETWTGHRLAQIRISHLYLQVRGADKVFLQIVVLLPLVFCVFFCFTLQSLL